MASKLTVIVLYVWLFAQQKTVFGQTGSLTIVSPQRNQTVPVDYNGNTTSSCSVQGDGLQVVWEIDGTQIRSSNDFQFQAGRGIWIDPPRVGPLFSTITFSAAELQANNVTNSIVVECRADLVSGGTHATEENSMFLFRTFDAPSNVRDLDLQPSLSLEWSRPSDPPFTEVNISYTIESNATEEDGMNFRNFTSDTSLSVQFLDDMLQRLGSNCVEFEFFVSATNDAGTGPLARVQDTVPISPDVRNVSRDLRVMSVDVQSQTAEILFPPVMPCSVNFSLTNYTINIDGAVHSTLDPGDVTLEEPLTISNLTLDGNFSLTVRACNNVTCRTSQPRTLNTTDVQAVQVVFFENRLFLQCSFADNSQARGCVFKFTVGNTNRTDPYSVSREEGFMCTEAPYRRDAYISVFVMDWEKSGVDGRVALNITNIVMNVSNLTEYTELTGCVEVVPTTNTGAIVGGAVGGSVLVLIIAIVAIVVILLFVIGSKQSGTHLSKFVQVIRRIVSDGDGDKEIAYKCAVNTEECEDRIKSALQMVPANAESENLKTEDIVSLEYSDKDDAPLILHVHWEDLSAFLRKRPTQIPNNKDFSKLNVQLHFKSHVSPC